MTDQSPPKSRRALFNEIAAEAAAGRTEWFRLHAKPGDDLIAIRARYQQVVTARRRADLAAAVARLVPSARPSNVINLAEAARLLRDEACRRSGITLH